MNLHNEPWPSDDARHEEHGPVLARLHDAIAAGRMPDEGLVEALSQCTRCEDEARRLESADRRLREAAALLDLTARPPALLRLKVEASVARYAAGEAADAATVERAGQKAGTPEIRRRTFSRFPLHRLTWAAGGAIAASLVLVLWQGFSGPSQVTAAEFTLTGTELAPGASGTVALRVADGGSIAMSLEMKGLPPSRAGEFYELWWVGPEKRHVSCGSFRVSPEGKPVELSFTSGVNVAETVLLEVTLETDNGNEAPGPHVAQ